MAKIELSKKIFPGEGISFAEKLKQIKILDKDVAYEQLIHFANMVSACLEVYGEENVIWQERDLHSLITPIVSISGHGVKAPPPPPLPPPPPPSKFKTAPKNSAVVKAQNLLELFEKNTFSVDKFKNNFVSLSRAIKSAIELDLNNKLTSEEDINNLIKQYNTHEKKMSMSIEISARQAQCFISIIDVSYLLIDLASQRKIGFADAQQILDDFEKQSEIFTSKQQFQEYLYKKYKINNVDIKAISYKDVQKWSMQDIENYRKQYQDEINILNNEIQDINAEIRLYSLNAKNLSDLRSNKAVLQEKLVFLQNNVSIIDRFNWQIVALIAVSKTCEQQLQFYKDIYQYIDKRKVVKKEAVKTKRLADKRYDYDYLLAERITNEIISKKINILISEGGIFKSCLSTEEYLGFINRAKIYLLQYATLERLEVLKLKTGMVLNIEFCQFIEELILQLNTVNRKGYFALTVIEKELLNFADGVHLFHVTLDDNDQQIIEIQERLIPLQKRANYQLARARLAYEKNKYFAENFKGMLQSKKPDFFVTDLFTSEDMEKIINFLGIENNSLDYDSQETNDLLLNHIEKIFSKEQRDFIDLIKDNADHRKVYPICQIEDLLERLIMTDKPPYKLIDLINKPSARQYAQKYKAKDKQTGIKDIDIDLPIVVNVTHLENKKVKSPPPFIRANSSKLLFNFNTIATLEKEINQPEISTVVFDANFNKTFELFYAKQQTLIEKHKNFYKQIDEEAIENILKVNNIENLNEMSIYHDLAIVKENDQSIKILQEDLEDGSKKSIDLINVSYKTEISTRNHIINKNIVKVDALKVDDNNELEDKSCIIMLLSIKNLSKNKKFTIEYCEDRPETAMKFFLFGKILGLMPTMNAETKQAIEQANITPLKSCYLKVIEPAVSLSSTDILELLNKSLPDRDKNLNFN